jgi:hypothetical protein
MEWSNHLAGLIKMRIEELGPLESVREEDLSQAVCLFTS